MVLRFFENWGRGACKFQSQKVPVDNLENNETNNIYMEKHSWHQMLLVNGLSVSFVVLTTVAL